MSYRLNAQDFIELVQTATLDLNAQVVHYSWLDQYDFEHCVAGKFEQDEYGTITFRCDNGQQIVLYSEEYTYFVPTNFLCLYIW